MFFRKKNRVELKNSQINIRLAQSQYAVNYSFELENFKKEVQKIKKQNFSQHIIITNTVIAKTYAKFIEEVFFNFHILVIPDGENQKSLKTLEYLADQLVQLSCDRKSLLWALGGGVIGDLVGFTAAVYMRGISYVQIPTTLLSMVDSSVGGKTAVNIVRGKNFLGSFHQPIAVLIYLPFVQTLPQREIRCGLAEIIKSALIYDHDFFQYINDHFEKIVKNDLEVLGKLSYQSVAIKADVVCQDEKEQGLRAILNFGHTLAHAIESYFHYEKIKHGEAVAIGLGFAAFFSAKKKFISFDDFETIYNLLDKLKMPKNIGDLPVKGLTRSFKNNKKFIPALLEYMHNDKKNSNGEIHFIFIHKIGAYLLPQKVSAIELESTLQEYFKL